MKHVGKLYFRPGELMYYIFIICLAIFILGVQVGIKKGRYLQKQDLEIEYGIIISD